jgi:hypothetical protein
MRRAVVSLCVCWLAFCGSTRSNVLPLRFGMTPLEASSALQVPLIPYSSRGASEIYIVKGSAAVPGFYPVDTGMALQFRKGHLTGWKQDWNLRRPWPF